MPCGFEGCDYDLFAVIIEDWSVTPCYRLLCLKCNNIRQISFENFGLMKSLSNYLEYTMMVYGTDWANERIRKLMLGKKLAEDMR